MVRISWSALISLALLILLFPLKWILCALLAALIHEMAHILGLLILGGKMDGLWINLGGAVIDAWAPSRTREIISILAGPAGSLLLLSLYDILPELSVCGAIQGFFNLLPIYPLDGGRIRKLLVRKFSRILFASSISTVLLAMVTCSVRTPFSLNCRYLLVLTAAILFTVLRNNPCKSEQITLQ